jgi:hypothetical protein
VLLCCLLLCCLLLLLLVLLVLVLLLLALVLLLLALLLLVVVNVNVLLLLLLLVLLLLVMVLVAGAAGDGGVDGGDGAGDGGVDGGVDGGDGVGAGACVGTCVLLLSLSGTRSLVVIFSSHPLTMSWSLSLMCHTTESLQQRFPTPPLPIFRRLDLLAEAARLAPGAGPAVSIGQHERHVPQCGDALLFHTHAPRDLQPGPCLCQCTTHHASCPSPLSTISRPPFVLSAGRACDR